MPCTRTSTRLPRCSNASPDRRLSVLPPVVILCGGRRTRLGGQGATGAQEIPKPLVVIGGLPVIWHVIQPRAAQGFRRFLLATGYRGELIEQFVAGHRWPGGVAVECVDTGEQTPTGGGGQLV